MGRTPSKINQKIEDLLASNPLPKATATTVKKVADTIKKNDLRISTLRKKKKMAELAEVESLSDTASSLKDFSDKMLCDDSGYFEETMTSFKDDISMTDDSASTNILDSSYDAQEDQLSVIGDGSTVLPLRPLYFEIPGRDPIVTRPEVQEKIQEVLAQKNRGVIISGKSGSGKTSVILDILQRSYFGGVASERNSFYTKVVGFHFVQPEDPTTTEPARFVHSLAAQLTQHPAMRAYRDHLLNSPELVNMLSLKSIRENPSMSLKKAVLDPLKRLYKDDLIELEEAVILVDGIDQETSKLIANLLAVNILRFPHWLKLIITHRCDAEDQLIKLTHLPTIDLNEYSDDDLTAYVESVIFNSHTVLSHIANYDSIRKNQLLVKLVNFIVKQSQGSYLYPKMLLHLMSTGYITIKTASFKHLPQNLSEIFHLYMSIHFPTASSYQLASQIFSLCLSSPRPLFMPQVKRLLSSSLETCHQINIDYSKKLSYLLPTRSDGSLMFIHPDFTSWLTSPAATRFQVQPTAGHNIFVQYYSSIDIVHTSEALDFIHHLFHTSLFDQDCDLVSDGDRKFLYLNYKVDYKLLVKCSRVINYHTFISSKTVTLLNHALGSKRAVNLDR